MTTAQITLLVFAVLMEVGGFMGYKKAGSKPSLIAGTASSGLLFVAFGLTFVAEKAGVWLGAGVSVLLCLVFLMRLAKTKKPMPSAPLLVLSAAAAAILLAEALGSPIL